MSSNYAYTALSPDYADLAQPQEGGQSARSATTGRGFLGPGRWTRVSNVMEVLTSIYQRNVGLLLVIASQMFFSLMNVAVKKLNSIDPPVSALELILVRMSITYICSITYMLSTGVPQPFLGPKGVRLLLVFRGFAGYFSLFGIYFSLQYLSLSDATVLTFLAPLCTAASGALFLGEKFARREALAGLLSLVGVILIARPPFLFGASSSDTEVADDSIRVVTPEQRLIAVGVALVGVLGATGAWTSLRAIGKRAHPLHSLVSFSTQCIIVASVGMIVTKTKFIVPNRLEWLAMLVMIGLFGFAAQILLTMGLARETASRGSLAIYTQIVFATILERIFFDVAPSILSVVGTLVIIACALYVALLKESNSTSGKDSKNTVTLRDVNEDSLECGLLRRHSKDGEDEKGPDSEGQEHGTPPEGEPRLDDGLKQEPVN